MKNRDLTRQSNRMDRRLKEKVHDPYKTRLKLPEPTVCPQCGAVFRRGRWQWDDAAPADANRESCQACRRVADKYPAGTVTLGGSFLKQHKTEILNLIRNQEELEKGEHPLHRIMEIAEEGGQIVVTTTDIHLPRRIGDAVHRAYSGQLDYQYEDESYSLRVNWTRDE